ncbi:MAG: hypothetical protein ACI4PP_05395, partial [Clostridia bacterium]
NFGVLCDAEFLRKTKASLYTRKPFRNRYISRKTDSGANSDPFRFALTKGVSKEPEYQSGLSDQSGKSKIVETGIYR